MRNRKPIRGEAENYMIQMVVDSKSCEGRSRWGFDEDEVWLMACRMIALTVVDVDAVGVGYSFVSIFTVSAPQELAE